MPKHGLARDMSSRENSLDGEGMLSLVFKVRLSKSDSFARDGGHEKREPN
jgi:hypothetical protein